VDQKRPACCPRLGDLRHECVHVHLCPGHVVVNCTVAKAQQINFWHGVHKTIANRYCGARQSTCYSVGWSSGERHCRAALVYHQSEQAEPLSTTLAKDHLRISRDCCCYYRRVVLCSDVRNRSSHIQSVSGTAVYMSARPALCEWGKKCRY
jgi:hypothetical protein